MRPLWGTWTCRGCGALLGIDPRRRGVAIALTIVLTILALLFAERNLRIVGWVSVVVAFTTLLAGILCVVALVDRARLMVRTGFRCRRCGYDLQGQVAARCPECGTAFDPAERAHGGDAGVPQPLAAALCRRSRIGWVLLLVLGGLVVVGHVLVHRQAQRARMGVAPPPQAPLPGPR